MQAIVAVRASRAVRAIGALALVAGLTACSAPTTATAPPPTTATAPPSAAAVGTPPVPVSLPPGCADQPGRVLHIPSVDPAYGDSADYAAYLPPCYDAQPDRRYPVLVLLHGGSADERFWPEIGLTHVADAEIRARRIGPMIIVLPDGGPLLHSDLAGAPSFGSYVLDAVLPDVRRRWRTDPDRKHRAIGGISIGGRMALEIAAGSPQEFAVVGGHSATVRDPAALAAELAEGGLRVHLDVGDQDGLRADNAALAAALSDAGVPTEFTVSEGGHDRRYWSANMPDYLTFYDAALRGGP